MRQGWFSKDSVLDLSVVIVNGLRPNILEPAWSARIIRFSEICVCVCDRMAGHNKSSANIFSGLRGINVVVLARVPAVHVCMTIINVMNIEGNSDNEFISFIIIHQHGPQGDHACVPTGSEQADLGRVSLSNQQIVDCRPNEKAPGTQGNQHKHVCILTTTTTARDTPKKPLVQCSTLLRLLWQQQCPIRLWH